MGRRIALRTQAKRVRSSQAGPAATNPGRRRCPWADFPTKNPSNPNHPIASPLHPPPRPSPSTPPTPPRQSPTTHPTNIRSTRNTPSPPRPNAQARPHLAMFNRDKALYSKVLLIGGGVPRRSRSEGDRAVGVGHGKAGARGEEAERAFCGQTNPREGLRGGGGTRRGRREGKVRPDGRGGSGPLGRERG